MAVYDDFVADLPRYSDSVMVQKHLMFGDPFAITSEEYFQLKVEVAGQFRVHPSEVLMVGSAKLGFSISPTKPLTKFSDKSDIDLAIVSDSLFDQTWSAVHRYSKDAGSWPKITDFQHYLFDGWIRPDVLPPEADFEIASTWWEFFRVLTASGRYGKYKIAAGLYKSWDFLERYTVQGVTACRQKLEMT